MGKVIRQFYFVMGIRGLAKNLLGNKGYPPHKEGGRDVLTGCNDSSLAVDRLCDQTRGQNAAVTCFYFDFAARGEQTATSMLSVPNGPGRW